MGEEYLREKWIQEPEVNPEYKLGNVLKRITIFGPFSEPPPKLGEELVEFGKNLAQEGVLLLLGGQRGFLKKIAEGVVQVNGRVLISKLKERERQGVVVENVPGHLRGVPVKDWENIKDFLFHESTDAIILFPPSATLGTFTEAVESIDRMTYWGTIENSKLVPVIFVGSEWMEKKITIEGIQEKVSYYQILISLIRQEQQEFQKRGINLNKEDYIVLVDNPSEALEVLREWAAKFVDNWDDQNKALSEALEVLRKWREKKIAEVAEKGENIP